MDLSKKVYLPTPRRLHFAWRVLTWNLMAPRNCSVYQYNATTEKSTRTQLNSNFFSILICF